MEGEISLEIAGVAEHFSISPATGSVAAKMGLPGYRPPTSSRKGRALEPPLPT